MGATPDPVPLPRWGGDSGRAIDVEGVEPEIGVMVAMMLEDDLAEMLGESEPGGTRM